MSSRLKPHTFFTDGYCKLGQMRNFVIFFSGENFNLEFDGKVQPVGFFAVRRVEAETEELASEAVVNQLKNEPELVVAMVTESQINPTMTVKTVHEMPLAHKNEFTVLEFYAMAENES